MGLVEIGSLVPGQVKSMTYRIDTCRFLAWRFAVIRWGKDWLAQCQDNVTEWDIELLQPDFPGGAALFFQSRH